MKNTLIVLLSGTLFFGSCTNDSRESSLDSTPGNELTAKVTSGTLNPRTTGDGGTYLSTFVTGNLGYVGAGADFFPQFGNKDFYSYNPKTDSWTTIAPLPGEGRMGAAAFSVGGKGFVGGGYDGNPADNGSTVINLKDFWQFDPVTNKWTKKSDLPVSGTSTGFAIGSYGYLIKDNTFWKYDYKTDTWKQLPNAPVSSGVTFTVGVSAFVLEGQSLWEYNSLLGKWLKKADYPGQYGPAFSTSLKGYVVDNFYIYEYNPLLNIWTKKIETPNIKQASDEGYTLTVGYAFGIKDKGYFSIQYRGQVQYFYEYNP
jgi:hypothetical protein